AGVAEPVEVSHRQMDRVVDQVYTGSLQGVPGQILCRLADLPDAETRGCGHASGTDVAADGHQRGQHIAALNGWRQASALLALQQVVKEICVVVDVDQRVDQLDLQHPRLEQI